MASVEETFSVIVHEAEEGGFWAEVVELPGCGSQGETEDELMANVRQAILAVIKSYVDDGEALPFRHTATIRTLSIPVPA